MIVSARDRAGALDRAQSLDGTRCPRVAICVNGPSGDSQRAAAAVAKSHHCVASESTSYRFVILRRASRLIDDGRVGLSAGRHTQEPRRAAPATPHHEGGRPRGSASAVPHDDVSSRGGFFDILNLLSLASKLEQRLAGFDWSSREPSKMAGHNGRRRLLPALRGLGAARGESADVCAKFKRQSLTFGSESISAHRPGVLTADTSPATAAAAAPFGGGSDEGRFAHPPLGVSRTP